MEEKTENQVELHFIGFNSTVKAENRTGRIEILVHSERMQLTDEEIISIKNETEIFIGKLGQIIGA